jgi:hypothetical protein
MITASDSLNTVDQGRYFAILPSLGSHTVGSYAKIVGGRPIEPGYSYSSGTNENFLTVKELRQLIREHVDPNFNVA